MAPLFTFFVGLGSGCILGAFALLLYQLRQAEVAERLRREEWNAWGEGCRKAAERSLAVRAARARLGRSEPGSWGIGPFLDDLFDDNETIH